MIDEPDFHTEDFTVVLQPFMENIEPPKKVRPYMYAWWNLRLWTRPSDVETWYNRLDVSTKDTASGHKHYAS